MSKDGKTQMNWESMKSKTSISSGEKDLDGYLVLKGMTFNKNDAKFSINNTNMEYDLHKNASGLYLGNVKFALPVLTVENQNKKIFAINDLKMSSESDVDKNLFSTHFSMSIQSILSEGQRPMVR